MLRQFAASSRRLGQSLRYFDSNSVQKETSQSPKSYRMPVEEQILPFKTSLPVRMHNGRVLLYLNKQRLTTPQLLQLPHFSTFFGLMYLIKYNPYYLGYMTFPASLPIMIGLEILTFLSWISNKKHYKFIIERVYLYNNNMIQFTFSNKIRRKLKSTQDFHMFINPEIVKTPPHAPDGSRAWSQRGFPFPQELQYKRNPETGQVEIATPISPTWYGWTKYTQNYQNYIFPKSYEYANWEILVPLLAGRYIDIDGASNQIHEDIDIEKDYASVQQELEWVKTDREKSIAEKRAQLDNKNPSL